MVIECHALIGVEIDCVQPTAIGREPDKKRFVQTDHLTVNAGSTSGYDLVGVLIQSTQWSLQFFDSQPIEALLPLCRFLTEDAIDLQRDATNSVLMPSR